MNSLSTLPTDLLREILSRSEDEDTLRLSETCRDLRHKIQAMDHPIRYVFRCGDIMKAIFEQKKNVLIHGPAGCGKSTVIKKIISRCLQNDTNFQVIAPTAFAAEIIPGATTIHSFAGIPIWGNKEYMEKKKRSYVRKIDLLIVDEISMFGSRLFELFDLALKRAWQCSQILGGVQVVMVGDFCQLSPVRDKYLFTSSAWNALQLFPFCLDFPLRQYEDRRWFDLLTKIRRGEISQVPTLLLSRRIDSMEFEDLMNSANRPMLLASDNKQVEEYNRLEFERNLNPVSAVYHANDSFYRVVTVDRRKVPQAIPAPSRVDLNSFWRAPLSVSLKLGARYLVTQNLNKTQGIINGTMLTYLGDNTFSMDSGKVVHLRQLHATFRYPIGNSEFLKREQFALRLGFALTIHKSQGMTLNRVICDFRAIRPGQFYVAISRVRRLEDLFLRNLTSNTIPLSKTALHFLRSLESSSQ